MNRHSSNNVKILKIAASATKHTIKFTANERNSVASIKFGKPSGEKLRRNCSRGAVALSESLDGFRKNEPEDSNGRRLKKRNRRLRAKTKIVASHGPTYGERVPTRDSDSPRSEIR